MSKLRPSVVATTCGTVEVPLSPPTRYVVAPMVADWASARRVRGSAPSSVAAVTAPVLLPGAAADPGGGRRPCTTASAAGDLPPKTTSCPAMMAPPASSTGTAKFATCVRVPVEVSNVKAPEPKAPSLVTPPIATSSVPEPGSRTSPLTQARELQWRKGGGDLGDGGPGPRSEAPATSGRTGGGRPAGGAVCATGPEVPGCRTKTNGHCGRHQHDHSEDDQPACAPGAPRGVAGVETRQPPGE